MNMLKMLKWFFVDQFMFHLGGGGGGSPAPSPTSQTVTQTNIPEYAQPYVETMLGATQQQLFNTTTDPTTGQTQITGVKPYVPYSTDPSQYVAPFSPMQQQAFQGIAGLQTPSQFGAATAGTMQGTAQALGAGQQYAQQATSPYATAAYMNPYLQQSLAPQLQLLAQQGNIASQQAAGQATGAGAFGGSRSALAQNLAQQNALLAQQQAIGQGYNQAFQQAQQAQQFGAGLGLQGAQAGIQGAGQLAGIGAQQLAAQQGILGLQGQAGAQQQAQQQNIINQAIQNYATAQQYPQQQLAFMNAQLRGLPLQTSTVQGYQAAPSPVSQIAGLGTAGIAGLGLYNALNTGTTSDIRTKENIELVGWLPNGLPVYEFEYKPEFKAEAGEGRYRGVMAQDVEKVIPDAIVTMANGYKGIKYALVGTEMERV
jgi:Chaperone of endosialidase